MDKDTKIFSTLDKAFWMVWGALPFLAGLRIYFLFTSAYFGTDGTVSGELPIMEFSLAGKILACSFLGVGIFFYVLLLGFMHALIRQFQHGNLFVERTLKCMTRIAAVLISWPFAILVLFNATSWGLFRFGDLQAWTFQYGLDLPLIAAGLVILALRLVMSRAIKLHLDAQYTV
ncbi:MAG: hypothetical protein DI586_00405 [Micavibrio aeruginosavorus]|uniref:DUF2975 domain-containing protein n=1 Tax=Micavibrio aeruginosavorus TaxID=349221 RepID=A0A2W5HGQ9_9BACT|nr:MAG: hypothetical protein DI586_00405 [Micavibrio aeruginosavorus]